MEQELLISRVRDAARLCDNTSFPKFLGFLRPEETGEVLKVAERLNCKYLFYGGYNDAERVFFGVFPDWCEEPLDYFPISALTFKFRESDILTHRQFLGTLMSLGIKRESVGDILIERGRAVVFFTKEVALFVLGQIEKIGGTGVTLEQGFEGDLPERSGFQELSCTVASARLDCVVGALAGCSRNSAVEMLEGKLVTLNSVCSDKSVKAVRSGDRLSIRGVGKFVIESIDEKTKKGRLKIIAKKYI